ncbi:hypothetical protein F8388_002323, partial [Cannabis sativa]
DMEKKKLNSDVNQLHIAVFPWLAQGHLLPFFQVSMFLVQKGHRVSFITTPKNHTRLPKNLIPSNLSHLITFVDLPLPTVDGLPDGAESTADLPIHKVPFLKRAFDGLQPSLTKFLQDSGHDITWIVHDFACYWLPPLANRLGIKLVFFSIFNATSMAFGLPPSKMASDYRSKPEDYTVVPNWWKDMPYEVAFKLHEIESHWDCMDSDVSDFQRIKEVVQGCHILLVRTCPEFEPESLSLLKTLHNKPVLPIGLLPPFEPREDGDHNRWDALKLWLDYENRENNRGKKSELYYYVFSIEFLVVFMGDGLGGIEPSVVGCGEVGAGVSPAGGGTCVICADASGGSAAGCGVQPSAGVDVASEFDVQPSAGCCFGTRAGDKTAAGTCVVGKSGVKKPVGVTRGSVGDMPTVWCCCEMEFLVEKGNTTSVGA